MFKVLFSVGVLSIPSVFALVGAVPGTLLVVAFGAYNTYAAFSLGAFRLRHAKMHVSTAACTSARYTDVIQGLQDMAFVVGGKWYRELVGLLYIIG